ncbi:MAG TPA: ROK family protein, partial [Pyrinomonadaceae bacterium]|nr:ROK family protein [Pyrinomonadaceae bacterium]
MKNGFEKLIFAADLGGTHLRAATVDERGTIHFRSKQNTPQGTDPNQIVTAIVNAVGEYKQESGAADGLRAISLVVPGTVNVDAGTVVKAPNLPCL